MTPPSIQLTLKALNPVSIVWLIVQFTYNIGSWCIIFFVILLNLKHLISALNRDLVSLIYLEILSWSFKFMGVIIDKLFTYVPCAQRVVKSCNYHILTLRRIRHLLSRDFANTIACSIVGLQLDYCKFSLCYFTFWLLQKLLVYFAWTALVAYTWADSF